MIGLWSLPLKGFGLGFKTQLLLGLARSSIFGVRVDQALNQHSYKLVARIR